MALSTPRLSRTGTCSRPPAQAERPATTDQDSSSRDLRGTRRRSRGAVLAGGARGKASLVVRGWMKPARVRPRVVRWALWRNRVAITVWMWRRRPALSVWELSRLSRLWRLEATRDGSGG